MKDSGFSLTEVLVALFILSLAAVFLSQATGQTIKMWDRTGAHAQSTSEKIELVSQIAASERRLSASVRIPDGPELQIDEGAALILSSPRIDETAACEFDMVGRRCR